MSRVTDEVAEQQAANTSSAAHRADFANHRQHTTTLVAARAPQGGGGRLCVLGAGNCNDIELGELAAVYREIHLVDIDQRALERATSSLDAATRAKIKTSPGIDVSGLVDRLDRWKALQVTLEELTQHAHDTSERVVTVLGGGYDVVLSSCLLTQMQLMVVNVLGESHRLFEAVRHTLTVTHLRTVLRLLALGGAGLFTIDATSDQVAPLGTLEPGRDLRELFQQRLESRLIFHVAHPDALRGMCAEDPILRQGHLSQPLDFWIWHNGPHTRFLVYAIELRRSGGGTAWGGMAQSQGGGGGGGGSG